MAADSDLQDRVGTGEAAGRALTEGARTPVLANTAGAFAVVLARFVICGHAMAVLALAALARAIAAARRCAMELLEGVVTVPAREAHALGWFAGEEADGVHGAAIVARRAALAWRGEALGDAGVIVDAGVEAAGGGEHCGGAAGEHLWQ